MVDRLGISNVQINWGIVYKFLANTEDCAVIVAILSCPTTNVSSKELRWQEVVKEIVTSVTKIICKKFFIE